MHVQRGFALTGGSRAADMLGLVMYDVSRARYNARGYFPTATKSLWLEAEYGIPEDFYDTRFNTDTARAYLALGRRLGIREFVEVAEKYAAFLLSHAKTHSYTVGVGETGILVQDYSHPDVDTRTHVSLNHQLAEILFLYTITDTGFALAPECAVTADAMLRGIALTRDAWIAPDGDLYYAYFPDGSFGMKDYPTLTYDDLLELQRYLETSRRGRDQDLEALIRSKQAWMENNSQFSTLNSRGAPCPTTHSTALPPSYRILSTATSGRPCAQFRLRRAMPSLTRNPIFCSPPPRRRAKRRRRSSRS